LRRLWGDEQVGIYQLAPLCSDDVLAIAETSGVVGEEFLKEVDRANAGHFANRPITLEMFLNSYSCGKGLPSIKTDLYRQSCLALCDERRDDLRRSIASRRLSSGLRFAIACRVAAILIFCGRTGICTARQSDVVAEDDIPVDDVFGGIERFKRELTPVGEWEIRETVNTGLFRSIGRGRLGFSHNTYTEYLAAQYLVDRGLPVSELLRLILQRDGSGKAVPGLREVAAWLAALVPAFRHAMLSTDPASLFVSNTPPCLDEDRRILVRKILGLCHRGELLDVQIVPVVADRARFERLKYPEMARDLRVYTAGEAIRNSIRLIATAARGFTVPAEPKPERPGVPLNEDGPFSFKANAAVWDFCDDEVRAALERGGIEFSGVLDDEIRTDLSGTGSAQHDIGNLQQKQQPKYISIAHCMSTQTVVTQRWFEGAGATRREIRFTDLMMGKFKAIQHQERIAAELFGPDRRVSLSSSELMDLVDTHSSPEAGTQRGIELLDVSGSGRKPAAKTPRSSTRRRRRRNDKYLEIESALREIAEARPKSHQKVFASLEERKVPVPNCEPFKTARGWLKGVSKDPHRAAKWLSTTWGQLELPPFPRGPKK
jgi:hypothetical protein